MSEWKEYKLGDIVTFGNGKVRPNSKGNIPIYGGNGILGYCDQYNYSGETIIVGRVGAYCGSVYYENKPIWVSDNALALKTKHNYETKYVYYLLKKYNLNEYAEGSSHPLVTQTLLTSIEVIFTDNVEEQKRIASILSSLDDKIDLLHRENATLEAMSETLFRQWFIEGAKEDWEQKSLSDCIMLIGGGTPKTSESSYWEGNISWLSGGDIANNHKGFVLVTEKSISDEGLNKSSAKLLPKNAMVISARGTIGKYCLLGKPMAFSQSNYGIMPKYDNCFFFTYLLIAHNIDELQSAAYGSVFDTITIKTFEGVNVMLPQDKYYIIEFEKMLDPYFSKMKNNASQIQSLVKNRDLLLSNLMSKEINI